MILYHGSNTKILSIDFEKCRPYKDFGKGFYLTQLKEQAERKAYRVSKIYGGEPIINTFEFNDSNLKELNVLKFDSPNEQWAHFVINNRNKNFLDIKNSLCNADNKYDIVIGPVANDDLALLFRQFEEKMISVEYLIKEMTYKNLTNQFSFHTKDAINFLSKIED